MSADKAEDVVRLLAEQSGVVIRPEHMAETVAGWRLMQPHLELVSGAVLGEDLEPAPLFRP